MIISSSTDFYSSVSSIVSDTLGGFWGFIILIMGIIFTFFIIELILKAIYPDKYRNEIEYIEK